MSSTNNTTNYELPLFIGTDKPTWLGDFNGAMNKIDTVIKNVSDVASGNTSTIGGVQDNVDSLETQVGTLENTVEGHTSTIASQGASITGLQTTVNQHSTQISAINSELTDYSESAFTRSSDTVQANIIRKFGKNVNCILTVVNNTIAPNTAIATIPNGYIPAHDKFALASFLIGSDYITLPVRFGSDGYLSCPAMQPTTIPASIYIACEYDLS